MGSAPVELLARVSEYTSHNFMQELLFSRIQLYLPTTAGKLPLENTASNEGYVQLLETSTWCGSSPPCSPAGCAITCTLSYSVQACEPLHLGAEGKIYP